MNGHLVILLTYLVKSVFYGRTLKNSATHCEILEIIFIHFSRCQNIFTLMRIPQKFAFRC